MKILSCGRGDPLETGRGQPWRKDWEQGEDRNPACLRHRIRFRFWGLVHLLKQTKPWFWLCSFVSLFFFSPGNVFLHQEVQEASQNSIGNETLSSNFISSFWKVSRCGFQSAGTPRLSYRFGTTVSVTNVILQCAVMVVYCSMKQRVLFQWHQAAFWGLNTFVRDSEVSGW